MIDEKRQLGIDIYKTAPWGTHICQFYQTKEDLIEILVPYFAEGLKNNEFCMWVTSEPLTAKEAESSLREQVKDLDTYIKKGQIEILDYQSWYTKSGKFEAGEVLEGWVKKEQEAVKKGFDGLRLTGNTFWIEEKDWKSFVDYEETVNNVIGKYKMLAICTYSLEKCDILEILDVAKNHQFAIIRRAGRWEIIENSEQKNKQAALEESGSRYRELFNSIRNGVTIYQAINNGKDFIFEDINRAGEGIEKVKKRNIIGKSLLEKFPGVKACGLFTVFKDVWKTGKAHHVPAYYYKDKRINGWRENYVYKLPSKELVSVYDDITARMKSEEEMRKYKYLVDNTGEAIAIVDNNGILVYSNKAYDKFFGAKELKLPEVYNGLKEKGFWEGEIEVLRKDKSKVSVFVAMGYLKDVSDRVIGRVAMLRDLTELKREC